MNLGKFFYFGFLHLVQHQMLETRCFKVFTKGYDFEVWMVDIDAMLVEVKSAMLSAISANIPIH